MVNKYKKYFTKLKLDCDFCKKYQVEKPECIECYKNKLVEQMIKNDKLKKIIRNNKVNKND